ncbi:MAG TPA: low temperature requirement protein A, partial [Pseudonocardiaceae bacterium]|nr:low temperature requirement protein A [Pseudonocardiaceae bacterium]
MTGSTRRPGRSTSGAVRRPVPSIGLWRRAMLARDREQEYRSSTPLELFFDLCFVVAVAQAGTQLHHGLADAHGFSAVFGHVIGYAMAFFAIWWAWVNFTWFASAYDTDDVFYRLLTLLQIAGVLVLAAGIPVGLETFDFAIMTYGYVIMRIAMIAQWIRVSIEYPPGRPAAIRYAVGIGACQIGWLIRLALPQTWGLIFYGLLIVCEMSVPIWAETRGRGTSWHPDHIYDRYSCFTLIVLGECVSALTLTMQGVVSGKDGLSVPLVVLAVAGLLLVFALWWAYFKSDATEVLRMSLRTTMIWAYSHFLIFASVAALGATLSIAAETVREAHPAVAPNTVALMVAVPVAVFLITGNGLHGKLSQTFRVRQHYVILVSAVVVGLSWPAGAIGLPATVALMALVVVGLLAVYL